jgi:hypothetical protein
MHRIGLPAAAGLWALLICGHGQAAEPQGWLYFVNAAARPLTLVVDGSSFDVPARARVVRRVDAGPHGLAAVLGSRTVSQYDSLDTAMLAADHKGRVYWCYLAGEIMGAPRLTQMDAVQCRTLVDAGDEDPSLGAPR